MVVHSARDARFQRDGADLWHDATVAVADAALGTTLSVPTLEKPAEVTVSPGAQPGAVLRLRGKGLPHFGGSRRGDIYLRLRVEISQQLAPEERALYERLRALSSKVRR